MPYELGEEEQLSKRQLVVIFLASYGFTNKSSAGLLGCSQHTVQAHWRNIRLKMRLHSKTAIVAKCIREGIIP